MDEYEIDDFVEESRQRQKPWDNAKEFLAEIASCGVNTVSAMDAVLLHDGNIRAEERRAAAERVCEDCRSRGNIDCDIVEPCETRSAILNEDQDHAER